MSCSLKVNFDSVYSMAFGVSYLELANVQGHSLIFALFHVGLTCRSFSVSIIVYFFYLFFYLNRLAFCSISIFIPLYASRAQSRELVA